MKSNIIEKKEGIFYFFKTLFGNTQKEEDLDNIINSENIDDNTKKEIENSQKRIKEMLKEYDVEKFEALSKKKVPKIKGNNTNNYKIENEKNNTRKRKVKQKEDNERELE